MNSDSESLHRQLLARLLTENVIILQHLLDKCKDVDGKKNPLDAEATTFKNGEQPVRGTAQTFQLGETPTVQQRFQTVIKRRLKVHFQDNLPLFPWETQLVDYPEYADEPAIPLVPAWGWAAQQSKLNLPIPLPEKIFQQLLEKCQALLGSSLPLGAKLVQAVESFFPDDSQAINDVAGLVLRSNYRSGETLETMPNLENSYSDLQPRQQMALSLLAAKQLLENLTLPISAVNPVGERQWLTSAGILTLKVEYQYQGEVTKLRVHGELPTKGILKLQGETSQAMAQSTSPGCLSVELCCTQQNQTYTLEVELKEIDQQPLLFVIVPSM